MQPECTFVQLPPDLPIFIKPQGEQVKDFRAEWYQFVRKGKDSRFYVNPYPKFTSDITLTGKRVKKLINNSIKTAEDMFEITPKVIFSPGEIKYGMNGNLADSLMTPLLYNYNSLDGSEENPKVIAIGDMPMLIQKEVQARALFLDHFYSFFKYCILHGLTNVNLNF